MNGKILAWAAGTTALVLLSGIVFFVAKAGSAENALTQLEVALFSILLVILQGFLSVVLTYAHSKNRAQEKYGPFVGSALRRMHAISEGIGRARAILGKKHESLTTPSNQAVESILTELQNQANDSVEDWKELNSAEFDRIESVERQKHSLDASIDRLSVIADDLENLPDAGQHSMREIFQILEQLKRDKEELMVRGRVSGQNLEPAADAAYGRAIEAYTELLEKEPNAHTLYIGRAKAHGLRGDLERARSDLAKARDLQPDDPSVEVVERQIESGRVRPTQSSNLTLSNRASRFLATGDTEAARDLYERAGEAGLSPVFLKTSLATVDFAEGELDQALSRLDEIDVKGDFVRISVEGLRALVSATKDSRTNTKGLRAAMTMVDSYDFSRSPFRYLKSALDERGSLTERQERVFRILEGG